MLMSFDYLFQKYQIKCNGVLHIGAHFGQEAPVYQSQGIEKAIWIEALPEAYKRLVMNVSGLSRMSSYCIQACVSDMDGEDVLFNVASNEGQSSSFLEFGMHAQAHPNVKFVGRYAMRTKRVDTLLAERGLLVGPDWFLNIDLQGAELLALKGMRGLLRAFSWAYIEVNAQELYKGCPLVADIDRYLALFGFEGMESKMTNWGWGDKLYQRK